MKNFSLLRKKKTGKRLSLTLYPNFLISNFVYTARNAI